MATRAAALLPGLTGCSEGQLAPTEAVVYPARGAAQSSRYRAPAGDSRTGQRAWHTVTGI